jgi:hypothetical protein
VKHACEHRLVASQIAFDLAETERARVPRRVARGLI